MISTKYTKKYRLAFIHTNRINDSYNIVIHDEAKDSYSNYYACEEEFDTEEEALEHAANSEDWKYNESIIILPVYHKNNF